MRSQEVDDQLTAPWLLLYSKPNAEAICVRSLTREGLTHYFPRVREGVRCLPLFPRYLFVQDQGLFDVVSIRYLVGISDIVRRDGDLFSRVSDDVIRSIRAREDADGFVVLEEKRIKTVLVAGQHVTVAGANGIDLFGKFQRMRGADRALILLSWLGSTREATVSLNNIRELASA